MICSRASTLSVLAGPGIRLPQQGLRHSPDIKASDKGTVAGGRDDQLHQCGMYLDMDIFYNETFPLHQVESDTARHTAVFKSTRPTGVTNDFMISSARHPAFAAAISKLPVFYSTGPFFITWVVKDYLLVQPSLPSPTLQMINSTELTSYTTDLESSTWRRTDA
ncbi:hypothetical protein BGZ61DRAFT_545884 [Ilyonectria robusta]|uniref:uncharacterized protein n=1 Tax=Ilyonectria robusta TaxID=1079257 RepID=UPI001E8D82A3|nr:uncharacterized protein BGZ61DRAFT_545884 [Ilyonectria robusta]KAH8650205.1 hypothetical protein BGZ61DRAFT_545884 [Ilyonectria robusta]